VADLYIWSSERRLKLQRSFLKNIKKEFEILTFNMRKNESGEKVLFQAYNYYVKNEDI